MKATDRVNILLVDDQPAKLLSYEAVLGELGENLVKVTSAREALEQLLKRDFAVILVDVCMPDLDGFQLAAMIREHPRFQKTAIIFISAIHLGDVDRLRGYEIGAVDYVPVPVVPEVLRAKVKVFCELYRKTQELEKLNQELERRVAERTAELESSTERLKLALEAGRLGTWDWSFETGALTWSDSHVTMLGFGPGDLPPSYEAWRARVHPDDLPEVEAEIERTKAARLPFHYIYRALRRDGSIVWCEARGRYESDANGVPVRMLGVVMDITEHKQAEEHQRLMVRELHHRVKNTLATVQAIAGFTARSALDIETFRHTFADRIISLSKTHTLLVTNDWQRIGLYDILESELGSFDDSRGRRVRLSGQQVELPSDTALSLGMVFHEMTTNAAKYGALSRADGRVDVCWRVDQNGTGSSLTVEWTERGGPRVDLPKRKGFGTRLIENLMTDQLGAKVKMSYCQEGIELVISVPLECAAPASIRHQSVVADTSARMGRAIPEQKIAAAAAIAAK
jgi:PAS domain S-box-containing protein